MTVSPSSSFAFVILSANNYQDLVFTGVGSATGVSPSPALLWSLPGTSLATPERNLDTRTGLGGGISRITVGYVPNSSSTVSMAPIRINPDAEGT